MTALKSSGMMAVGGIDRLLNADNQVRTILAMTNWQNHISILEQLGTPRLLVLGDFILDRYTWGNAGRVSPEAPVLVLQADREEARLGGAAGVCYVSRGLQAEVTAVGAIGDDDAGRQIQELMREAGIADHGCIRHPELTTTVKERFIGRAAGRHPQQILRVDREVRQRIDQELQDRLLTTIRAELLDCHALLISDYDKGVCTPRLLKGVIAAARQLNVPVVVDPARIDDYSDYRDATLLTPNRYEVQRATGATIEQPDDVFPAGQTLCDQLKLEAVIVTLDRDGMALVRADGSGEHFPTLVRDVYDITGAGDMVLAMVGICAAAGCALADAVQLANVAAGLEVERVGVEQISREEIRADLIVVAKDSSSKVVALPAMIRLADSFRKRNRKIVFTNGCFDIMHTGHVYYLQEAAKLGDVLVVGLNSDESVHGLKGSGRPINNERDRAGLLAALACVDYVVTFGEDTPCELLRQIRPDVLVKGGTYSRDEVVGREIVEEYGGQVCVTGMVDDRSTTKIVEAIQSEAATDASE